MQIFRRQPKRGTPLRDPSIWEGIQRMARAWETLDVQNGHIDWSFGRPTIVVYSGGGEGGGGRWTGRVIVAGGQLRDEDFSEDEDWPQNVTDKWLRIPFDHSPCTFVGYHGTDIDEAAYRQVASEPGVLSDNTQGDIVIDYIPYYA